MVSTDRSSSNRPGSYRRTVMKAVGAGAVVGAFSGVAAADEHDDESTTTDSEETDSEDETPIDGRVHTVRTLITQSTDPGRPADFFYQPTGIHIDPGDVIKFVFDTPDHTVTSYHPAFGMQRRMPSGVQPFSSPILGWDPRSLPDDIDMPPSENGAHGTEDGDNGGDNGDNGDNGEETDEANAVGPPTPTTWLYAFETPGVYDLECAPHEGFGMAMRVVVGDETETAFETSDPDQLLPPRAGPVGFARLVLTDPNLEPESIVERGRVEWLDLEMNQEPENGVEPDDAWIDDGTDDEDGDEDDDDDGGDNS